MGRIGRFAARQGHGGAQAARLGTRRARPRRRGPAPTERTIESPRPAPSPRAPRSMRWKGSSRVGRTRGVEHVAVVDAPRRRCARRGVEVVTDTRPPGRLWPTAFSTRFATRRSSRRRSPATGAGCRSAVTASPARVRFARGVAERQAARRSRGRRGSRRVIAPSERASVSSDWTRRSVRSSRVVDRLGHRAQLGVGGLRVGERHLELGAHDGQRRAQLVRRVGHEAPLAGEGARQPLEHRVEGVGQLLELVARALQGDALVERVLRDAPRRRGDPLQRAQHAPGDQPAQQHRERGHRGQRERVLHAQARRARRRPPRAGWRGAAGRPDRPPTRARGRR